MLAVLSGLPNGVRDGVRLFGRELGGGQCARDGVGVEHRPIVLRVVPRATERLAARFVNWTRSEAEPDADPSAASVRGPLESDG